MARTPNTSRQTRRVLETMCASPGAWLYGYELSKKTGLKSGTLYPILIRLNDQGFLISEWRDPEREGRPPRHVYRLSASGRALARKQQAEELSVSASIRPAGSPA